MKPPRRRCLLCRLYWAACAAAAGLGLAGTFFVVAFPPEIFDDEGRLLGEMPPAFAAALMLAALGLTGGVAGGLVRLGIYGLKRLRRRRPD